MNTLERIEKLLTIARVDPQKKERAIEDIKAHSPHPIENMYTLLTDEIEEEITAVMNRNYKYIKKYKIDYIITESRIHIFLIYHTLGDAIECDERGYSYDQFELYDYLEDYLFKKHHAIPGIKDKKISLYVGKGYLDDYLEESRKEKQNDQTS